MAIVTVGGTAWDHAGRAIPSTHRPELWMRPNRSNMSGQALLAGVEVKATLNVASGAFSVLLDNDPAITYRPFMRWLLNPEEPLPERWSWGEAEWAFDFNPGAGGDISELVGMSFTRAQVVFGHGAPPAWLPPGSVYFDTSTPVGIDVWAEGRVV